jgi:glycosyltransferase involved in cell wall biosynthesis
MKIGMETECLNNPTTGIELAACLLIDGIIKKGHELVCYHTENEKHPAIEKASHHLFKKPLPFPFANSFNALFHNSCFDSLDIMHFSAPKIAYLKKPKASIVISVYDIGPLLYPEYNTKSSHILFKYFLPKYMKQADAIITSAHCVKKDIIKNYPVKPENIHVIPIGILQKTAFCKKKEPYLLFISSLFPRKNVVGLVEAFSLLCDEGFPYKLIIVGQDKGEFAKIKPLIDSPLLKDRVIYKGYVSEEEKSSLLEKASLLIMPSFYEGFGIPVLEAFSYATPVVASNVTSLPEVVGDAGVLINPFDVNDIARGIKEALLPDMHPILMEKALKRAEDFSYDKMVDATLDVYSEVLKKRKQ